VGADNGATGSAEVFDLDALARDDSPESFAFTVEGRTFYLANPGDLDWHYQSKIAEGDPAVLLGALLGDDQFAEFDQFDLPGWKLDKLLKAWGTHVGIDVGELEASPTSSATTGTPSRPTSARTTAPASRTSRRGG
jgi:hypothetical protein